MRGILVATSLALACAHAPRAPSLDGWRELRSPHFRLWTNLPSRDARTTLDQLETLRAALGTAWSAGDPADPPGTTNAIVLRDPRELRSFTVWTGLARVTRRGPLLVAAGTAVALGDASPRQALLAHEVAHDLDHRRMPGAPRWFDEGLASYLELAELVDAGRVRLGEISRDDLEAARTRPLLPLDDVARTPWETTSPAELTDVYRSSRLWVQLLRVEEPARIRTLEAALERGAPWRVAWVEARRDLDTGRLEDALRRWLHGGRFPTELHRFTVTRGPVEERALATWEVHLVFAELWKAGASTIDDDRSPRVRAELEAAALAAPDEPLPKVLLADLETHPDRRLEAAAGLRRAYPRSPDAAVLLARILRDDGGPVPGRREAMLDAVVLAPDDVDALTGHALEEARSGEYVRAFGALRRAEEIAPWNPTVFLTRAAILGPLGECEEAVDAVQRALDVLPDAADPTEVQSLVGERARVRRTCRPARVR